MKTQLIGITFALTGLVGGAGTAAAECGEVTIASMNWQSAEILANVDKIVLQDGFGCTVNIVQGDTVPTLTSMSEKNQPDIAPESWVQMVPAIVDQGVADGKLQIASISLPDGGIQGWYIPKYVADAHPEIKTIADALKRPDLFPDPEDSSKGTVVGAPQGWNSATVMAQLFKAYKGTEQGFTLTDPGSAAGLDGSIAKAYERKQGWIGLYWAPTALLGKYEMVRLEHGVPLDMAEWKRCTTVATCPDPKENDWPRDVVKTVVTKSFADRTDQPVMEYLNKRAWKNDLVNKLLAWMTDNQADGEEGARYFLKNNEEIWKAWVSPEVAEKIKATL